MSLFACCLQAGYMLYFSCEFPTNVTIVYLFYIITIFLLFNVRCVLMCSSITPPPLLQFHLPVSSCVPGSECGFLPFCVTRVCRDISAAGDCIVPCVKLADISYLCVSSVHLLYFGLNRTLARKLTTQKPGTRNRNKLFCNSPI